MVKIAFLLPQYKSAIQTWYKFASTDIKTKNIKHKIVQQPGPIHPITVINSAKNIYHQSELFINTFSFQQYDLYLSPELTAAGIVNLLDFMLLDVRNTWSWKLTKSVGHNFLHFCVYTLAHYCWFGHSFCFIVKYRDGKTTSCISQYLMLV